MTTQYINSLLDPFDNAIAQPKIYDGSVGRSSGLRFRTTGNLTMNDTALDNYFILLPSPSQILSWYRTGLDTIYGNPAPYPQHLDTVANRSNIRQYRMVSAGLRLNLMNANDANEGYWEAIRVPLESVSFDDIVAPIGENFLIELTNLPNFGNFSNFSSYQSGQLRDIGRFQFKLNSTAPEHPFVNLVNNATPTNTRINDVNMNPDTYVDPSFDCIIIKIVGRNQVGVPSVIMYDAVCNQEVVYKQDTIMEKLATQNVMLPEMAVLLDRTRYQKPAVQIS